MPADFRRASAFRAGSFERDRLEVDPFSAESDAAGILMD